ncbi:terpene synthase family protein [Micromonospora costi]|uniref:terpene synthase family protein n=1 Tax=Micromonospora costi TaxID=1530042 RepID=UPI001F4E767A|nr:terpene synthase family protein [Micromonospora costi]
MRPDDELTLAAEQGRICALAAKGQRDLQRLAAGHPELFSARPFDPALYASIAMAMAFSSPWCAPEELRFANRAVLWGFAVDWQVDYLAKSREEVDRITADTLAVVDGADPAAGDPLGRFLAELRDELAGAPGYAQAWAVWRDAVARTLAAMAREWDWREATATGRPPSYAEYLDNADNLACTVVNVAHWIRTGDADIHRRLPELIAASDQVQRVLRLVNDLATHERDREWGDLNAITLVGDPAEVARRAAALTDECRGTLADLAGRYPREARYLGRQLGYTSGFYGSTDFWGAR